MDVLKTAFFDYVTARGKGTDIVEQFVRAVLHFNSQYGSDISVSYSAMNLCGKPSNFPDYGDFPQSFVTVSYLSLILLTTFPIFFNLILIMFWFYWREPMENGGMKLHRLKKTINLKIMIRLLATISSVITLIISLIWLYRLCWFLWCTIFFIF